MADLIRDAPIGQIIRWITNNRRLQYAEEKPGFKLPTKWTQNPFNDLDSGLCSPTTIRSGPSSPRQPGFDHGGDYELGTIRFDRKKSIGSPRASEFNNERKDDSNLQVVDWYGSNDSDNPYNWSNGKRFLITLIICLYTFVVYMSSAIYTSSTEGVMKEFKVTIVEATLGLSLYVLGYGIGPLIFSPLSEIPSIGRNPVYIITMTLFVIISVPTAFASDFHTLVALRFFQGFFGSPCLASGGASVGDIYSMDALPYAMLAWVSASYCGPALGPLLSGFSVPAMHWRWSLFETIWASVPVLVLMFLFLPETSSEGILFRRAQRLSKLTGKQFVIRSHMDKTHVSRTSALVGALIKPIEISFKDPAVLFVQIYTSIIYGIYYSCKSTYLFEVFPLVYPVYYGMSLGQMGLVFLCVLTACILGVIAYSICLYVLGRNGFTTQERRLLPALGFCFGPTIGLFMFAWTARSSIHWIAPTIGITIYGASVFVVFQCLFIYIPLSYPNYAASLFAANDFFRSALACASVSFAHPLFTNLGVARGVSVLGGLSLIGIVGIWLLYWFGGRLRAMSKFAAKT